MGTVYRKTYTKPLPAGAELFNRNGERLARWKDAKGKTRTAGVTTGNDGSRRIVIESPVYVAKYRDGRQNVIEKSTGCRDADAARSVLRELERRAELVKSKVLSTAEDAIADHQSAGLESHFDGYREYQQAKGVVPRPRRADPDSRPRPVDGRHCPQSKR
jgi:hypothetical protein